MEIKKIKTYTIEARIPYTRSPDWNFRALLLSDIHVDNPKCDRDLLTRHLEQARKIGAPIMVFGDLFCAMQGKYDKRANKSALRPEHQVNNYLDALIDTTADFFEAYKDLICFITPGNHETAILGRHETDLTARLAEKLGCERGTYSGWVLWRFEAETASQTGGGVRTIPMSYHHGYGGGGPVTKDVIQTSRKAVYLPDAKIVVSGHTHDRWIFPISRIRLKENGEQVADEQLHVKLGSYKDEYNPGEGWAVEKGMPPKPLGGVWLIFHYHAQDIHYSAEFCR
jgi:UDP-2,3-diacylglucosamine pyrophosphatase LpxH